MLKKMIPILTFALVVILGVIFWRGLPVASVSATGTRVQIAGHEYLVEVMDTMLKQAQGLSGRKSLPSGHGMLFVFKDSVVRSFWMKGMKFPIDIIWINGGKVADFVKNAPVPDGNTPTFGSEHPVDQVLELPAGTVAKDGIKKGDSVKVIY